MRIWIDLANSPHVHVMKPIADALEARGEQVVLTARDHAQTIALASAVFGDRFAPIGGESPTGLVGKAKGIGDRTRLLREWCKRRRVSVALSHGSYAQLLAARSLRIPTVTMMDYEFQPANHLSFRIANRVIVPAVFPAADLRRCGANASKVVRYDGFKEDLYLSAPSHRDDQRVAQVLSLDTERVIGVFRPAPEGALYHRGGNVSFDSILERAISHGVQAVVLPRLKAQETRLRNLSGVIVPDAPVDGISLLREADLFIGAGGTMSREAAILGTRAYTVFAGKLAAVDRELIRLGWLFDLRQGGTELRFEKKLEASPHTAAERGARTLDLVVDTVRNTVKAHDSRDV
jgi:predicted glycosyltransferase